MDMDFRVILKLVPMSGWMFPEELVSVKHSLGVTVEQAVAHGDAVA